MKHTLTSPPEETPAPHRTRGRRLVSIAVASAGLAGSIAIIATLDMGVAGGPGPAGSELKRAGMMSMRLLAALASLVAGLIGVLDLHQAGLEESSRGRALGAGTTRDHQGPFGHGQAVKLALLLALGALTIMTLVEMVALATFQNSSGPGDGRGAEALAKARERQAGAEATDNGLGGSQTTPGLIGPGSGKERSASGTQAQLGNLLSDQPLLAVTVRACGGRAFPKGSSQGLPVPSLHLRGLALTGFRSNGAMGERTSVPVSASADPSGWTPAAPDREPGELPRRAIELFVEFQTKSNGVVFAPERLRSIEAPGATHDQASDLWRLLDPTPESYGLRAELPSVTARWLREQRSAGIPGTPYEWTELPEAAPGSPRAFALVSLGAYARSLVEGSSTDLDAVLAVVTHLRGEFGYELYDTSFLSPEGCMETLERGSGSCTHFASIAVYMLRSVGIPTRIAIGYVAREPMERGPMEEAEDGAALSPGTPWPGWTVRARDGHAWIEVFFEGAGWLLFDPTPGDLSVGGAMFGWSPLSDEPGPEVEAGMSNPRTSAIGSWIAAGLTRLGRGAVGRLGVTGALLAAAVVLLGAVAAARRQRPMEALAPEAPRDGSPAATAGGPAPSSAIALMSALDERGFRQQVGQTPTRFAASVESEEEHAKGLGAALRALLGRASTGRALNDNEVAEMQQIAAALRKGGKGPGE